QIRQRLGATGEGIHLPQEVGRELAFNLGRVNDNQAFAIREGHAVINHEVSRIPCGPGRPSLKTQQQADRRREPPQARSTASAGTTRSSQHGGGVHFFLSLFWDCSAKSNQTRMTKPTATAAIATQVS